MILTAFDLETTGLDKKRDHIIEMGLALYSTGQKKILESCGFLVDPDGVAITEEITGITNVYPNAANKYGYNPDEPVLNFIDYMRQSDALLGHNISWFDLAIVSNTAVRLGTPDPGPLERVLVIDTMTDLPGMKGEQLITMLAKLGAVNPNQHNAEDDAKSVIKLVELYIDKRVLDDDRPIPNSEIRSIVWDEIIARAKSPLVLIKSEHDRSDEANQIARKAGFRWKPSPYKFWWQALKEMDIEKFAASYSQDFSRLDKEITLEQLRDN